MEGSMTIWKTRGASKDGPLLYVERADSFWRRFLGLMGREKIDFCHAMLLYPCSSIHMCFMRFSIDAVYLKHRKDQRGSDIWQVIRVVQSLRPWLGISACAEADAVLELREKEAQNMGLEVGTVWGAVQII